MTIRVKVTPNAKANQILGWENDPRSGRVLRLRLQAPPVDGKANKALVEFLAKELGVPRSGVRIGKGATSRLKVVVVPDGTVLPSEDT